MSNSAVSLILVTGKEHNMNYLVQGRDVDKSDHERKDLFQSGNYPFYWPGAVSLFGGGIEEGETWENAFIREIKEELGLDLSKEIPNMDYRVYNWKKDTIQILNEANDFFQGNVPGFLGFNLDEKIPSCALGNDRKKFRNATYRDWLYGRETDYYLAANIGKPDLKIREGVGLNWSPHWLVRAMTMVPVDKLAILDDMTKRIKSGELEIKLKKK